MITDYFMVTEKSNRLQAIMITGYGYPISVVIITVCGPLAIRKVPLCFIPRLLLVISMLELMVQFLASILTTWLTCCTRVSPVSLSQTMKTEFKAFCCVPSSRNVFV